MNMPERHIRVVPDGPDAELPPIYANMRLSNPVIWEEVLKHKEFHQDLNRPDFEYHYDFQGQKATIFDGNMLAYWTPDTYRPPESRLRVGHNRQIKEALDRIYQINRGDIAHLSVSGISLAVTTRREKDHVAAQSAATQFLCRLAFVEDGRTFRPYHRPVPSTAKKIRQRFFKW